VDNPELNFAVLDGDSTENQVLSSVTAYPFMSSIRITCMREFYPKADMLKGELGQFIKGQFDGSALVILNSKPCEQLKKIDSILMVDCNKAEISTIIKWIIAEANKNGVGIDEESSRLIAEFCSSDMTRIETETNKLISSVGDGGIITVEHVKERVARDTEYKIYELTDFIAKKKIDQALLVIQDMLSKGETMQRIIVYVYNYFRRLLHAAISGKTAIELAELLGIKEFAAKKLISQANSFKKRNLKNAETICLMPLL
jgi:DNA polymerase-3 subunit delta